MYARMLRGLGDDPFSPPVADDSAAFDVTFEQTVTEGGQIDSIGGANVVTTSPSGDWVNAAGICKPANADFLSLYKAFQNQLNRIADVKGIAKISVDGAIGSQTLGLFNKVRGFAAAGTATASVTSSCDAVSLQLATITGELSVLADSLGASSSVSSPAPQRAPSFVNVQTKQLVPQGVTASLMDTWNRLTSGQKLVVGGLAAVAGVFGYRRYQASRSK